MDVKTIKNIFANTVDKKTNHSILIKPASELKPPSQKDLYILTVLTQNIHPDDLVRLITDVVPAPTPTPPAEAPEAAPVAPTTPAEPAAPAPEGAPAAQATPPDETDGGEINAIGADITELMSGNVVLQKFAETSPHEWSAPFEINQDVPPLFPGPQIHFFPFEVEFIEAIRDIIVGLPLEEIEAAVLAIPALPPGGPNQPPDDGDDESLTEDGEEEGCIEESLGIASPISLFPSLLANSSDPDLGLNPTLEQLQAELDVVNITNVRFIHPTGGTNFGSTLEGPELGGITGFDHINVFFDPAFPDNTVIIIQGFFSPTPSALIGTVTIIIDPLTGNLTYHNPDDLWDDLDFISGLEESIAIAFDYQVQDSGGLQSDVSTARIEFCGEEELPPVPVNDCFLFEVLPQGSTSFFLSASGTYADLLANDSDPNGDPLEVIAIDGMSIPTGSNTTTFTTLTGWTVTLTSTGFTYSRVIPGHTANGILDENDFDSFVPITVLNDFLVYLVQDSSGLTSNASIDFNLPPTAIPDQIEPIAQGFTVGTGVLWIWSVDFTLEDLMDGTFSTSLFLGQEDYDLNLIANSSAPDVLSIVSFIIDSQEIFLDELTIGDALDLNNPTSGVDSLLTYLGGTTFRYSGTATTPTTPTVFTNFDSIQYTLSDGAGDLDPECTGSDTTTVEFLTIGSGISPPPTQSPASEDDCFTLTQTESVPTGGGKIFTLSTQVNYSVLLANDLDPNVAPLEVTAINGFTIPSGSFTTAFDTSFGWHVTLTSTGFTYSKEIQDVNGNDILDQNDFSSLNEINEGLNYTVQNIPFGLTDTASISFNTPPTAIPDLIQADANDTLSGSNRMWSWSFTFTLGQLIDGTFSTSSFIGEPDYDLNIIADPINAPDVLSIMSFILNNGTVIELDSLNPQDEIDLNNSNPNIDSSLTFLGGTLFRYAGTATTPSTTTVFNSSDSIQYTLSDGVGDADPNCTNGFATTTVQFQASGSVVSPPEACIEFEETLFTLSSQFGSNHVFDQFRNSYSFSSVLTINVCCDMDATIDKSTADTGTTQENNIIFALSHNNFVNTGQGDNFAFATGCCWLEETTQSILASLFPTVPTEAELEDLLEQEFLSEVLFNNEIFPFLHIISELECCENVTNTVLSGTGQDMVVAIGNVNFVFSDIVDLSQRFDPVNPDLTRIDWSSLPPRFDTAIVQGESNQVLLGGGVNSSLIVGRCEVSNSYGNAFNSYFEDRLNSGHPLFSDLVNVALEVARSNTGISNYVGGLGENQVAMISAENFLQVSFDGTTTDWVNGGNNQILMIASDLNIAEVGGAVGSFNTVITLGSCPQGDGMTIADPVTPLNTFGDVQGGVPGDQILALLRQSCCTEEVQNIIDTGLSDDSILAVGTTNDVRSDFNGFNVPLGTGGNDDILVFGDTNTIEAGGGNNRVIALGCCEELDIGFLTDVLEYFSLSFSDTRLLGNQVFDIPLSALDKSCAASSNTITTGAQADDVLSIAVLSAIDTGGGDDFVRLKYLDTITPGSSTVDTGSENDTVISEGLGEDIISTEAGEDLVLAGDGDDIIDGGDDIDELHGEGGDDTILGGSGNDDIFGGTGDDDLFGEEGDDLVSGDEGNDFIDGGIGDDQLFGESGIDEIHGGDGDDDIFGGTGDDTLFGEDGVDFIDGQEGADKINGGAGDDMIVFDPIDASVVGTVDGGADCDTLLVQDGEDIDFPALFTVFPDSFRNFELIDIRQNQANTITLDAASVMTLNEEHDVIAIQAELVDTIILEGPGWMFECNFVPADACQNIGGVAFIHDSGAVVIIAGTTQIFVDGILQNFSFVTSGTTAQNPFVGTMDNDIILGTDNADHIFGDTDRNLTQGTAGNDHICAGGGDDVVSGDAKMMSGQAIGGDDEIEGGDGSDRLYGDALENIAGQAMGGEDTISGGNDDDFIVGDTGNHSVGNAIGGNDHLFGDAGNDTVIGDSEVHQSGTATGGDDDLHGGEGSDLLIGDIKTTQNGQNVTGGNDMLFGDAGDDVLIGDVLTGAGANNSGDDELTGGEGDDILDGGENANDSDIDTAFYSGDALTTAARAFINGDTGSQAALVTAITATDLTFDEVLKAILGYQFSLGSKTLMDVGFDIETFTRDGILVEDLDPTNGDDGEDLIVADLTTPNDPTTSSVERINFDNQEYELINGVGQVNQPNTETILGTLGNDIITGGIKGILAGYDLNGNTGTDILTGGFNDGGNYTVNGDDDNDVLIGGPNFTASFTSYTLNGGNNNDILIGGQNNLGNYVLNGDSGNDVLIAGLHASPASYTLNGGAGDDTLIDGVGNHTLTGGTDEDTFVFDLGQNNGSNTVTDFELTIDHLMITGLTDQGGDTVIELDDLQIFIDNNGGSVSDDGTNVTLNLGTGFGSIVFVNTGDGSITSIALMEQEGFQIEVSG